MEKIKIPCWSLGHSGDLDADTYLVVEGDSHSHWSIDGKWLYNCGGECVSKAKNHLEIKNYLTNDTMKITNLVKKILDADTRTLVKAGFINGDLALTDEGVSELLGIVFLANKEELLKVANEKLNEDSK